MDRFVKSFLKELNTIKEEDKSKKVKEFREVSGGCYLVSVLKSDEKEGLELIRGLFCCLPQEIEGPRVVLDILEELDEQLNIAEVVLMGAEFLCSFTKKLLGDFERQIIELTSGEREDVSETLLTDLLFLVRNKVFGALFVDEFEFCVDSLVKIQVDPSNFGEILMYMHILEIMHRLPKENSTSCLFQNFMDEKLADIALLCPFFEWEEYRWLLNFGVEFRKVLICAYISWLSPSDVEGALILLDVLEEEPLKISEIYVMARKFFFSLGKILLVCLRNQAIEIAHCERIGFLKN